jgi:hypothetical protein
VIPRTTHEEKLSPSQTHGVKALKRAVSTLGRRTIDRRTTVGKALAAYRADLIADLGGVQNLSKQELSILEEAVITTLLLSSVNAWLLSQKTIVNKRTRSVIPAVRDRSALVATLKGLLESLGLERRTKSISTLADIVAEYAAKEKLAAEGTAKGAMEQAATGVSHAKGKAEAEGPEPEQ